MRAKIYYSFINSAYIFYSSYFTVLCSNRLSQMTRTYDDIEAVTRLLEEKEKDLELTAHIGKDLLAENTRLKKQVEELENDVKVANENCIQLKYELTTKCNLLAALTNDEDAILGEEESKFPQYFFFM